MPEEPLSRIERLELDIDTRLVALWAEWDGWHEWDDDTVAMFVRAAYGIGYHHALTEEEHASLYKENGYRPPRRNDGI